MVRPRGSGSHQLRPSQARVPHSVSRVPGEIVVLVLGDVSRRVSVVSAGPECWLAGSRRVVLVLRRPLGGPRVALPLAGGTVRVTLATQREDRDRDR